MKIYKLIGCCFLLLGMQQAMAQMPGTPYLTRKITSIPGFFMAGTLSTTVDMTGAAVLPLTSTIASGLTAITNNGSITLKANHTYKLSASLYITGNTYIDYAWVNSSNVMLASSNQTETIVAEYGADGTVTEHGNHAEGIVVVGATDMIVRLYVTQAPFQAQILPTGSYFLITEIMPGSGYIYARPSSAQVIGGGATADVPFTSVLNNLVPAVSSSATVNLPANAVYEVNGNLHGAGTGGSYACYMQSYFSDAANAQYPTTSVAMSLCPGAQNYPQAPNMTVAGIVPDATAVQPIKMRTYSGNSGSQIAAGYSFFEANELKGQYLMAKPSADQYVGSGTIINLTSNAQRGLAAITGSSTITLQANKTYKLVANIYFQGANQYQYANFSWHQGTTATLLPTSSTATHVSYGYNAQSGSNPTTTAIVVVGASPITVSLQCDYSQSSSDQVLIAYTSVQVVEL